MIGYKKLRNNLIAKLSITGDTTENYSNEIWPRNNLYASHLCSSCNILEICDLSGKQHNKGIHISDDNLHYHVGQTLTLNKYCGHLVNSDGCFYLGSDERLRRTISACDQGGILYFKTYKQARDYCLGFYDAVDNGIFNDIIQYFRDGKRIKSRFYNITRSTYKLETFYEPDGTLLYTYDYTESEHQEFLKMLNEIKNLTFK